LNRAVRKGERRNAWILPAICGYPATKGAPRGASVRSQEGIGIIPENPSEKHEREQGGAFMPKFDSAGLITAVVTDAASGDVLMVGFMDAEALEKTRKTGFAHFHSRSRGRLWKKGETSGNTLEVEEILVDCDQDALVLRAVPAGPTCHTGAASCFYRRLHGDKLEPVKG
jgi:phosphoribosyl-AMP cyclohydrolase